MQGFVHPVAAWIGAQASSLAVALVLGLQHALSSAYFPVPLAAVLVATMAPSLVVTGVVEGAYTLGALALLRRAKVHAAP